MSNIPTGWLCPRCSRMNAPTVQQCSCGEPVMPRWSEPEPAVKFDRFPGTPIRSSGRGPGVTRFRADADVERYSTRPPAA